MPASKTKKYKVIPNPELMTVGRAFVPAFGSDEDLQIVKGILDLESMLPGVDNQVLRGGDRKKLTAVMKRILSKEQSLIHAITRRNMDF